MKTIAALIDFTPTCSKTVEFAAQIALKKNITLTLIHIAPTGAQDQETELQDKMDSYLSAVPSGVRIAKQIDYGTFTSTVPHTLTNIEAEMVVVGTHGKLGIMQNLLGSHILKLSKSLPIPSLTVQDHSVYTEDTFGKLLLPTAKHENFEDKLKQTALLAKPFNSTVYIICIQRELQSLSEDTLENITKAKAFFEDNNIKYEVLKEEPKEFSVGYAKQILKSAEAAKMGTLCIISKVSKNNNYFGNVDKENMLLNEKGIPVFCANIN